MTVDKNEIEGGREVLVVDDTPASLQLLTHILTDKGYLVRPASGGMLALRSVAARIPDLILLDVKMPEMDGFEVCRRLKQDERTRSIPVLFISAYGETADKVRGFEAGGVDYITKPFEPEEVAARVRIQLEMRDLAKGLEVAKETLEQRVRERTAELAAANSVLQAEVAERKRAELERERLVADLARSNRELEQFAYVASHDLQEPIRMVSSYVGLLDRKYRGQLDEKADSYIHFAVDGAERMHKLIEGLLEYSRAVRREVRFRTVDMNAVFSNAVSNLSASIRETQAVVTKDDLPAVFGDEVQLIQLLQNLIGNGIKYHKQGVPPVVRVSATRDGADRVFSVRDNGIGIDPRYFERIFQIFQRLHSRDEYPGTGIGLSICKRIVDRHHGRVWIESSPGDGSTFFFTIPIEEARK